MAVNTEDHSKPDESCANCATHKDDVNGDVQDAQPIENTFRINVKLPHAPYKTQTIVSTQEQAQDIRQAIIDVPDTFQYSCFHLEREGERIPDFVDLSEIPGVGPDSELVLVEDPYTEKDARVHFLRVRELIGAAGDRTDTVQGLLAGLSLHDFVTQSHENSKDSSSTNAVAGYDIEAPGSFDSLLQPSQDPAPKTIKSISLSPWNPPPYHLRQKGHLLYLQVTTSEGEQHQITSHITGFYVNKSSNSKFDPFPRPAPKDTKAHSLLTLISRLSPSFDVSFQALQVHNSKRDPLSAFQLSNAIPSSPWLVPSSSAALSAHVPDVSRTQETYLVSGVENAETLRDWNEEFQTTRELPRETVQDRVFRERVTSKLFADYNEAATQGAVLIARGEVAPLNPTEAVDAQIFVYNNVFYSFGADGVGTFANEGGDEAARVATGKDVMGVKAVNQLDVQGLSTPGTVIVDYMGKRIVGQSIVPGIFKQREPGEQQIDYGGVEGKEIVAENEAFPPLFKNLSKAMRVKPHAVWDKEGTRHELEASIETKGLLGTDGRKYVLDLYRTTPLDVNWIEQNWDKQSDGRKQYPHRMTVLRPELVDAYSRLKLRDYVREQMAKNKGGNEEKTEESKPAINGNSEANPNGENKEQSSEVEAKEAEAEAERKAIEQDRVDISAFQFALNPDVFCGQQPQTDEERAEWAKDEADVRTVADYLRSEIMPRLIVDLQEGDVGFPMDGQSLSSLLHKRGINMRYLGELAKLASKPEPRLKALKSLVEQEMIARAFKHVANKYLRTLPAPFAPICIAHLLNCLLGVRHNGKPKVESDEEMKALYGLEDSGYEQVTPASLQEQILEQVNLRYRYDLEADWVASLKPVQMLRELCLKLGLQVVARDYEYTASEQPSRAAPEVNGSLAPTTNGHSSGGKKKKNKGGDHSPARQATPEPLPSQTFHADDIVNIVPVLKEASPRSILAEEALDAGRISVAQNQKELGQELLLESLSLHEQIYGILHPEVARVYYQLSSLFFGLEDKPIAVELARKAVIVSERTLGIDHNETVLAYLNLGLFEHAVGNTPLALTYVRHALDLWKVVYGPKHPDSITTINNAAVMLQHLKLYHESRQWFEASLIICQEVSGSNSVNTATLLFQLAQALALDQDSHGAVKRMKESYNIFAATLGPDDRNTKEAETWLEQLTQNAVSIAKHAKDVQARKLRRNQLTPRVTLGTRPQPQVGQTERDASGTAGVGGMRLNERSVDELLKYIEGDDAAKSSKKKRPANPKRRQQVAA